MKTLMKWLLITMAGTVCIHTLTILVYPRAIMELVMQITEYRAGGVNKILHTPVANAEIREVVRPSPDMYYSVCILDVSKGPVKISTPVNQPYTSITIFASNTDNIFAQNDMAAVDGQLNVTVAGPAYNAEDSQRIIRLPTNKGVALIRRVFTDSEHRKEIDKSRRLAECREI